MNLTMPMSTPSHHAKREQFRQLIAAKPLLVLPGAYDALSARIAQSEGFSALTAGGFAAVGSMLAQPDLGQSNVRDYASHYARIAQAVDLPVYVDADTGFGGVHNVRQAVQAFESAGVAGMFLSDQTFPNRCGYMAGKTVIACEEMVAKIRAALDARQDSAFFICARTDAAGVEGKEAALLRCQRYMKAGADMAKPQGMDTQEDIALIQSAVPGPHFATLSQAAGVAKLSIAQLQALGVQAVTLPSLLLFAAASSVRHALRHVKETADAQTISPPLMSLDDYYRLVRLEEFQAREKTYAV